MKNLPSKFLYAMAFTIMALNTAYADFSSYEIFSHIVLNLPSEAKNETPWNKVITTTRDWDMFYSELLWDGSEPAYLYTAPVIDFDTYQLVAGGLGMQNSGGFSLSVQKVIEYSDSVLIDVLVIKPGENCSVTMAITYPTVAVLIKKTSKPLQFSLTNLTTDCS